ncbi:MAG: hypothetical protein IAA97_05900 [Spirochaetes bacterium]|uniref:Uncharacterized protein n=1 Tax=Candidatus Ornithospirochaeta stercoripullorum TaxID=2840899 RepID=A0A9D9H6C5_9SPIO|nr:hypothetical protein [Candidatus Ornithospirochaeta stercoripullorum]
MRAFLFIWEFPQIVLGFIILLFTRGKLIRKAGRVRVYAWPLSSSISLGWFCFVPASHSSEVLLHELGHTRQSLYLGPLYLFVIGIPSFVWAVLFSLGTVGRDYHAFYTERWAERLADRWKSSLFLLYLSNSLS